MNCARRQICVLFDAWDTIASDVVSHIDCKKAQTRMEYRSTFLSHVLHGITEYMRVLFDLECSLVTFDLLACGTRNRRVFNMCNIESRDFVRTITNFKNIHAIDDVINTTFVEAIETFLLEAPSDFVNNGTCATDVVFIAKHDLDDTSQNSQNTPNSQNNSRNSYNGHNFDFKSENKSNVSNLTKCVINSSSSQSIDFVSLMRTARIRNPFIKRVFVIRYCKSGSSEPIAWRRVVQPSAQLKNESKTPNNTNNTNNSANVANNVKNGLRKDIDSFECKNNVCTDDLECWECLINIEAIYDVSLSSLLSDIQFKDRIRDVRIINVPLNPNAVSSDGGHVKQISIPLFVCEHDVRDKSLYNYNTYFNGIHTAQTAALTSGSNSQLCDITPSPETSPSSRIHANSSSSSSNSNGSNPFESNSTWYGMDAMGSMQGMQSSSGYKPVRGMNGMNGMHGMDLNQMGRMVSLEWCKSGKNSKISWSDWIAVDMKLIALAKFDEHSRLLIKFLNKKKAAYFRAVYGTRAGMGSIASNGSSSGGYRRRSRNNEKSTHVIRNVGMKLYLCKIVHCSEIPYYSDAAAAGEFGGLAGSGGNFDKSKFPMEYKQFCLQSSLLPKMASYHGSSALEGVQCFKDVSSLLAQPAPFMNGESGYCVMQVNGRQQQWKKQEDAVLEKNKDLGKEHVYVTNSAFVESLDPFVKEVEMKIGSHMMAHCIQDKNESEMEKNASMGQVLLQPGVCSQSLYDLMFN